MVALFELGAGRAADALRNGEHTAEALAEALLARCAASPLNAFITLEAEHLRAAARAADQRRQRGERLGPLHGVPLALKDNIDTADFPTTGGTPALAAHRPKHNAPIVQHLLAAGAITGKWLSSNHDGHGFFEPQESKKPLGAVNIPHDDRAVVEMFYHASTPPCVPAAITPPCVPSAIISRVLKACRSELIGSAMAPHAITRRPARLRLPCKRAKRLISFNLASPSAEKSLPVSDAEPMRKSLIIAIIASLVSTLVNAKPYTQRRTKAQPHSQIACTVVGCSPVPAGCVPRPGRTWSGLPSGFDVIVCPPGGRPVR